MLKLANEKRIKKKKKRKKKKVKHVCRRPREQFSLSTLEQMSISHRLRRRRLRHRLIIHPPPSATVHSSPRRFSLLHHLYTPLTDRTATISVFLSRIRSVTGAKSIIKSSSQNHTRTHILGSAHTSRSNQPGSGFRSLYV